MSEIRHPTPPMDWESRPFWEGCGRHELWLQRCAACDTLRARPLAVCPECLSSGVVWVRASGRATLHTYAITHQNQARGFREALPYVLAYVDLEEGVRLLTNVVNCEAERLRIGMPLEVDFADLEGDVAVPRFRPA